MSTEDASGSASASAPALAPASASGPTPASASASTKRGKRPQPLNNTNDTASSASQLREIASLFANEIRKEFDELKRSLQVTAPQPVSPPPTATLGGHQPDRNVMPARDVNSPSSHAPHAGAYRGCPPSAPKIVERKVTAEMAQYFPMDIDEFCAIEHRQRCGIINDVRAKAIRFYRENKWQMALRRMPIVHPRVVNEMEPENQYLVYSAYVSIFAGFAKYNCLLSDRVRMVDDGVKQLWASVDAVEAMPTKLRKPKIQEVETDGEADGETDGDNEYRPTDDDDDGNGDGDDEATQGPPAPPAPPAPPVPATRCVRIGRVSKKVKSMIKAKRAKEEQELQKHIEMQTRRFKNSLNRIQDVTNDDPSLEYEQRV